jgi:hypothetical protein
MAEAPKALTPRVVLKRVRVRHEGVVGLHGTALDSGVGFALEDKQLDVWVPIYPTNSDEGTDGEPRIFLSVSKRDAIEQYAGKGGKDHPGYYRAIAVRSWKDGIGWKQPEQPNLDEEAFE